ncbi:uncharacterized protein YlxW (UPF0749 family) [Scopulibacillus darangshiensis]|uniref:Uncharacterized protein YlxW (UPF0749 family) n=1 Tax=Scopulibacillus darangshiensis TaxID=442528 RepID=A0A4R2P5N4_9BACL|nr:DUF881 domain-containing protein [Scopulibacillus darangshiensis]TCP29095.1 uncharacterized protein YlxW (UPF0749 family) [Scopulibacillus darangshiensis]
MKKRHALTMTLVTLIIGFMLAIQFETTRNPQKRDTRDIWQLQEDLAKEEKRHIELNNEFKETSQLLQKYKTEQGNQKIMAMKEALKELKEKAGVTEKTGQGVILHIRPMVDTSLIEESYYSVSAILLRRLINELNQYGASEIAVSGERIINTTPIRVVQKKLFVNDHMISDVPFNIHVLTPRPKDFAKRVDVSQSGEDLAREGLVITAEVKKLVKLPAYTPNIGLNYLHTVKEDS